MWSNFLVPVSTDADVVCLRGERGLFGNKHAKLKIWHNSNNFFWNYHVVNRNSLPAELRSPDMTLSVFRKQLKTHLFNCQQRIC